MAKETKPETYKLHLRGWLKLYDLTQTEAGEIAGCDQSYIANMIAGRNENINVLYLLRISDYMEVAVNDLYKPAPKRSDVGSLAELSPRAQQSVLNRFRRNA